MRVKNIGGTSGHSSPCHCCSSWLGHWRKNTGSVRSTCSVRACGGRAEVGAHVRKYRSSDGRWYIVPLCRRHNATSTIMDVNATLVHVGACR